MTHLNRRRLSTDIIYRVYGLTPGKRFFTNILHKVSHAPKPRLNQKDEEALTLFKEKVKNGDYEGSVKLVKIIRSDYLPEVKSETLDVVMVESNKLYREPSVDSCIIEGED